jgi:hypothetical protein
MRIPSLTFIRCGLRFSQARYGSRGHPEVLADIYTAEGFLKQRGSVISAAGTYKTWRQIAEPYWAKQRHSPV